MAPLNLVPFLPVPTLNFLSVVVCAVGLTVFSMLIVASVCGLLLLLTTFIHYEVLRLLTHGLGGLRIPTRSKLMVVICTAFLVHAVEVFLFALGYYVFASHGGLGTLSGAFNGTLEACMYFSAETYTSLGYGDVVPSGSLRLLAGMEALNGLLLIGWSASYTYIAMERFWKPERD